MLVSYNIPAVTSPVRTQVGFLESAFLANKMISCICACLSIPTFCLLSYVTILMLLVAQVMLGGNTGFQFSCHASLSLGRELPISRGQAQTNPRDVMGCKDECDVAATRLRQRKP